MQSPGRVIDSLLVNRNINKLNEYTEMDDKLEFIDNTQLWKSRKKQTSRKSNLGGRSEKSTVCREQNRVSKVSKIQIWLTRENTFKEYIQSKTMTFKKNPRHAIRQYGVKLDKHKLFNRNKPKEFWREVNKFIPGKQ